MRQPIQRTLALIKPDLYSQTHFVQQVLEQHIPKHGLSIIHQKEVFWSQKDAEQFYFEHKGKIFFQRLTGYMTSGPFLSLVLQGPDSIVGWRQLIGPTRPDGARLTKFDSLRSRYGLTDTRNSFHGSDSIDNANKEISLLFPELNK